MADNFTLDVPSVSGNPVSVDIAVGSVLYVLGANGTGKSSLLSQIFSKHKEHAKRISAHRQTWFESNTLDMTPRSREDIEKNTRSHDAQPQARYREWNAAGRANMAIYDLIDADTMQERKIAGLVRSNNLDKAREEARSPSPIQVINELMRLSNLPIAISVEEGQKIVARKNGSSEYSVAELSDGERNAFLIGADVLTAKPGTLILIDEPERHLHRSIISPLLKLLFEKRTDCAFVVSTHELMLPVDTPKSVSLLVRSCEYTGQDVRAWTVDILKPSATLDDSFKADILGSRRKIVFVEGTAQSLDLPLYSLLFPSVSVVPKSGCRDVEYAVRGLRGAGDIHWISTWGIIDNDQRQPNDVERLKRAGIWALPHYSVESLYYHPNMIQRVAKRQAELTGDDATVLAQKAIEGAIAAAKDKRDHLVASAVLRSSRSKILESLPTKNTIQMDKSLQIDIDIPSAKKAEESCFDSMVSKPDWDGLLTRYPMRESSSFDRVVDGLKFKDRATYQAAVLKLLQDNPTALEELRCLLGDLPAEINK